MKRTKELSTNKGITLIALVITIIVMLILVSVTISMAVNGGLFEKAGEAVSKTEEALTKENTLAEGRIKVGNLWYNNIDDYLDKIPSEDQDGVGLIQVEFGGTTFYATEGMIWGEWVLSSDLNTIGATLDEDNTIKVVVDGVDYWLWCEEMTKGVDGSYGFSGHPDSDEEIKISTDRTTYTYSLKDEKFVIEDL